ncbi:hypothetical protein F8388_011668 [Cannabis sativa]|uniref:Ubiquitin-like domain-containing protein n=1 Tax=Cannabis sativa TaxID=3483 RepID=A0A7J6FLM3_CANSA|nr:hypothetical protein G4B88_030489 [Cannabis sativa]KAF4387520.1 hypothetical protein F8388_011668 [Cannabis sativa]
MESGTSAGDGDPTITIHVKFGGRSFPILISPDSTIKELKSLLQPLTNVLPRGQKLISKGKLLVDGMTIRESEVTNGSKIMLMAAHGLHQGDGPVLKQAQTRPVLRDGDASKSAKESKPIDADKLRRDLWKATGVIALSECNLQAIPDEVWASGNVRLLDLSNNAIEEVSFPVGSFHVQTLLLNANKITDESLRWEGMASMRNLTLLSLNHNHLTTLPPALGELTSLKQLRVANNKLTSLPNEIGLLRQLEILKVNSNRITEITASIGDCSALIESLRLGNNGLKSLPSTLFKMCLQLTTLDLHNTEITMDILRQCEGWESFDERRRLKHQKQLDFRVIDSADFDEGADKK